MAVVNAFVSPLGQARRPMPAPPTTDMATAGPNMARQNAFTMSAPAAKIDGGQFWRAAERNGQPTTNASLNRIVDGVNNGMSVDQAAAKNPFAISMPQNPGPMANAFRGFATGLLGVDKVNAIDDRYKAQDAEAGKKNLAMLQQFRAMPVEQRMAALPQLSQAIGKQIPQEVMSDQAIDAQLAVMQGQLGIAPPVAEPMSAYQAAQVAMEKEKAGRPTPFNLGDGAFAEYNPAGEAGSRLSMIRQPNTPPVKYEQFTDATGQVWDVNPYTRERIKATGMRAHVPQEGGAGGVAGSFRTLTPEEVKAAGYSPGTVVQRDGRGQDHVTARPSTAQTGQPTESERAGGLHAQISMDGLANILKMESGGYNRAGIPEQATFGMGPQERLYDQATMAFSDGYLRAMTGAGQSEGEVKRAAQQFFPQFGDDATVIEQKAKSRINAIKAMKSKTGRAWNPEWDALISTMEAQTTVDPKVAQAQQMLDNWDQLPPIYKTPEMKRVFEQTVAAGKAPKSQWEPPPAARANVPSEAIADLMNDPSADAMQEFNDAFGPGAAEAILNGSR